MRYIIYTGMLGVLLNANVTLAASNPLMPIGKHDNHAPIEINADNLEVLQEQNKAIFTGHVVVIQGAVRLKSDKMIVYYRKQEESSKSKKDSPAGQNAIRRIDVDGNVFLSTPEETARGATGVYDVENHRITLDNQVVLTRGKNTLKGDHLVYDFVTGKSIINSENTAQTGASGKKERVRALFIPDDKEQKP